MSMTDYSYRKGLREAVAFVLVDHKGHVLLECRPDSRGGFDDIFYPSGSIEMKDHADGRDYRETALRREIAEEFRDGVTIRRAIRASTLTKMVSPSAVYAGWPSMR